MEELTILDQLKTKKSTFQTIFNNRIFKRPKSAADSIKIVGTSFQHPITETSDYLLDKHKINHGLTDAQVRILFKILAKEYENCGRKRGAILRYISHYEQLDEKLGDVNLFATLQSMDNKR